MLVCLLTMDNSDPRQRSYLPITNAGFLVRLLALAQQDRRGFRKPRYVGTVLWDRYWVRLCVPRGLALRSRGCRY